MTQTQTQEAPARAPAANSGGPNLAAIARIHGADREVVTCLNHMGSLVQRGNRLGRLIDTGSYEACMECKREAAAKVREERARVRRLLSIDVIAWGKKGDDEGGTIWFAFRKRVPEAEREYTCETVDGEVRHTEKCVEDTYRRKSMCEEEAEDLIDPALQALDRVDIPVYARSCHTGDWDCCGRIFKREPYVRRSKSWTLVTQAYGLDV